MKQVDFRSEDRLRFPPPSLAWVLARTDQLLLLGIDANHKQAGTYVKPPQAGQRAELRSRSGSLTSASCLRLVRSEKPASCNTRAMVFADTLIPWHRRALASFRVERCVHSKPVMGSPVAAGPIGIWGEWIDDRAFCNVEVLSKHFLEKGPAMDRPDHNLCEGKLHLAHRDLITVASGLLARREWM